jgi:predicted transcriptional regulator
MLNNIESEIKLLKRHVKILKTVIKSEPIGIIKLSELTATPQHKVRYSLRVLEGKGFIKPSAQGAVSTRKAKKFMETFKTDLRSIKDEITKLLKAFD